MEYYEDRFVGLKLTWSKFLEELRAGFYPIMIQRQKKKEVTELRMTGSMIVMQYASKFTKHSQFVPEFMASEQMKMRRFEEGLAFIFNNNWLANPSIPTKTYISKKLKWSEFKVKRTLNPNPNNQKRNVNRIRRSLFPLP